MFWEKIQSFESVENSAIWCLFKIKQPEALADEATTQHTTEFQCYVYK